MILYFEIYQNDDTALYMLNNISYSRLYGYIFMHLYRENIYKISYREKKIVKCNNYIYIYIYAKNYSVY